MMENGERGNGDIMQLDKGGSDQKRLGTTAIEAFHVMSQTPQSAVGRQKAGARRTSAAVSAAMSDVC